MIKRQKNIYHDEVSEIYDENCCRDEQFPADKFFWIEQVSKCKRDGTSQTSEWHDELVNSSQFRQTKFVGDESLKDDSCIGSNENKETVN